MLCDGWRGPGIRVKQVLTRLQNVWEDVKKLERKSRLIYLIKEVSFKRNCGATSVGVLQDNLVLSTELIM